MAILLLTTSKQKRIPPNESRNEKIMKKTKNKHEISLHIRTQSKRPNYPREEVERGNFVYHRVNILMHISRSPPPTHTHTRPCSLSSKFKRLPADTSTPSSASGIRYCLWKSFRYTKKNNQKKTNKKINA